MLTITQPQINLVLTAARESEAEIRGSQTGEAQPRPALARLRQLLGRLEAEELVDLMALVWIGRGDFDPKDLRAALHQAQRLLGTHPVEYLAGMSGLANHLERALSALGLEAEEHRMLPA